MLFRINLYFLSVSFIYAAKISTIMYACTNGDATACYAVANHYASSPLEKNETFQKRAEKVALYYYKACQLGDAKGCRSYAMNYIAGKRYDTEDRGMAYYFRKACNMGDETACTMLEMMPKEQ